MDKLNSLLSKTCAICGTHKPLSAFLLITSKESSTYGNICSSCRLAHKDKAIKPTEKDESSRTSTTETIDIKAKVQSELDQKKQWKEDTEEYHKDREKNELLDTGKTEKIERVAQEDKKRREGIFGRRPTSTSDNAKQEDARVATERQAQQAQSIDQTTKQETATKEEQKEKEIDLSVSVIDTGMGTLKEKQKGASFQHFLRANPTAASNTFGATPTNKNATPEKPKPTTSSNIGRTFAAPPTKTDAKNEPGKLDSPSEYVRKTWGPGSK